MRPPRETEIMEIEEFYKKTGGSYAEVSKRIPSLSLAERFISKFLKDKSFEDLSAKMKSGDRKGAFLAVHTLKGVCANLGFGALKDSCSNLCEELRGEGEEITEAANAFMKDVERYYYITVEAIGEYLNK